MTAPVPPPPTPEDMTLDVAALYALCEAAPAGPWWWNENTSSGGGWPPEVEGGYYRADGHRFSDGTHHCFSVLCPDDSRTPLDIFDGSLDPDAAAFIVAARTALPAALRRLAQAEARAALYLRERDAWIDDANALRDRYDALSRDCSAVQGHAAESDTAVVALRRDVFMLRAALRSLLDWVDELPLPGRSLPASVDAAREALGGEADA